MILDLLVVTTVFIVEPICLGLLALLIAELFCLGLLALLITNYFV